MRGRLSDDRDERIGWRLVVGTIPVGILGIIFEAPVRRLFGSPAPAALFLVVNGLVMFAGEALRRRQHARAGATSKPIEELSLSGEPARRRRAVVRVAAGHLALRHLDGRGSALRSRSRARRALFVLAGNAGHPRGGGARRCRSSSRRRRTSFLSEAIVRRHRRGCCRIFFGRFLDALLSVERFAAVRLVLRRLRRDLLHSRTKGNHHMRVIALPWPFSSSSWAFSTAWGRSISSRSPVRRTHITSPIWLSYGCLRCSASSGHGSRAHRGEALAYRGATAA